MCSGRQRGPEQTAGAIDGTTSLTDNSFEIVTRRGCSREAWLGMTSDSSSEGLYLPPLDWILEYGMDHRLIELYPPLAEAQTDSIEVTSFLTSRLRNVLERWQGLTWAPYLELTPNQLLARRNAGRKCLVEFLSVAERAAVASAAGERPREPSQVDTANRARPTDAAGTPTPFPSPDAVSDSVRVVVAWGIFERGGGDLTQVLDRAFAEDTPPDELADALENLRPADLEEWARPLAPRFDPWLPLRQFLESLSDDDRELLDRRLCSLTGADTLDQLGARRNVTRERIRQIEFKLAKRLRSMSTGLNRPLGRSTQRVRDGIGLAIQSSHLGTTEALADLGVSSVEGLEARALLWLAGPYQLTGDWLIRRPAQQVIDQSREVLRQLTLSGSVPISVAEDALEASGIARTEARDWVVSIGGFRIHDDVLVRWGGSMADRAEVVLRLAGAPLSRDELVAGLGPGTKWRSMVNQLYGDPRFKRTGVRHFGLVDWEHDEYTGVADEIAQEIERQGGEASLEHLIATVSSTYGVSPSSVRAYALGPQFERTASGSIQLRGDNPPPLRPRSPETTRGAFLVHGAWSYRMRVTDQHLRGSGSILPESIALLFGLEPLGVVDLSSRWGTIRLAWPSLSPHLGSIRTALEDLAAIEGDLVFLAVQNGTAELLHASHSYLEGLHGLDRLAAEVGGDPTAAEPIQTVAMALGLDLPGGTTTVARRLLARGEDELASLITDEGDEPLVLTLGTARFVEVRMSR